MRLVLDEGVPRRLADLLRQAGQDVSNFPNEWKGLKNGRLLDRVEQTGFHCLLTCDRSLRHQQSLSRRQVAVVVLPYQRFDDLLPVAQAILTAIKDVRIGSFLVVRR
jgi:hypothetical protein